MAELKVFLRLPIAMILAMMGFMWSGFLENNCSERISRNLHNIHPGDNSKMSYRGDKNLGKLFKEKNS